MAQQNINQYVYQKSRLNLEYDSMDMSLTSDERDYSEEVVFSPFLIAETYGKKLPINIDINNFLTAQPLNLTYKNYNQNNIFVSQNYYNPNNEVLNCLTADTVCDIGLTGIDNGLVNKMTGETLNFTEGIFEDSVKFDRLHYDRRFKMIQVTGYTGMYERFSGVTGQTLYEVISKNDPIVGRYHELYGGFYQGFYKLFGYDYEILPERVTKGWTIEMVLKPRLETEYQPNSGETTLNMLYPQNKNMFFYLGTRAENKFYHYADGSPKCFTGYTRTTTPLANCVQTCACCDRNITNSRCVYLYPPRSKDNQHDPHLNYGCNTCNGDKEKKLTCGCGCGESPCDTCGWECQTHNCPVIIEPIPTPTPVPTSTPSCENTTPVCTPSCTTCQTCTDCVDCNTNGFTSIEDTCEKDPLFDLMSNNIAFKLCGDPKNPSIGVKVLRFTGGCETTGTCTSGQTYLTGYTIDEYCSPPIYPRCQKENPSWLDLEHWFQVDVTWSRYTDFDYCDLKYFGGLADITEIRPLDSLANNTVNLIQPPLTHINEFGETIEIVNLNQKWLEEKKYRLGRLKIYVNGKPIYTLENFEEVIPRALNTDKEKQLGVPFNISWGGGTQGLHENLTFSSCSGLTSGYTQDPELFPTSTLSGTTFSGLTTNILLEKEFGGTFEGAISQFRMYVEPLSGDEVKHNFNVLKDKFNMFNPDCPDCGDDFCEVDDFTFEIVTTTTTQLPTPTPSVTPTVTPTSTPTPTPSTPMFVLDLSIDVTIISGSVIANIVVTNNTPVIRDTTISFVKTLMFEDDRVVPIDVVITIPEGQTSVTKQIIIDEDYDKLTEDTNIEVPVIDVHGIDNKQVIITENRQIHYVIPVKPGKIIPTPTPTSTPTPTNTPTSTPIPTNTPTPTNTSVVVLPTVYYGKYLKQNFDVDDLNLLGTVETNDIVNNYLMYAAVNGYCYMLIPNTMQQPTIFRNSNDGCSGFIIPFVKVDEITIIDSHGQNIIYYVYRSFVSTKANVDVWICD
jgi:hypothetical protein